jgi:hypothetical protein
MRKVFENGIHSTARVISAKPQFIVDGYLTAGALGVFLACLIYGWLASTMSQLAERWFGGYLLGSGLVYSALFQIFWRGNSFEFFAGTVFWSFVVMSILFHVARAFNLLVPAEHRRSRWPAIPPTPPPLATAMLPSRKPLARETRIG